MDLQQIVRQPDTTIIDVREPFEFNGGHVSGARNIPLQQVPAQMEALRALPGQIVLYCRSGNRSGMAAKFLESHGFKNVHNGGSLTTMEYFLLPESTQVR